MKKFILFTAAVLVFTACTKKSGIQVTSRISNCKLSNINFGDYSIMGSLITNQSSPVTEIRDAKKQFPKKFPLTFYMEARGNRVYLRTVEEFQLEAGGNLSVTLDDHTKVMAP